MVDKLKALNDKLIILSENDSVELNKQMLIKKLLSDEKCFFKMDIETSYALLRDLKIPEDKIKEVYMELINDKY